MMNWKYLRLFLAICFVFMLACCKDGKSNRLPESIGQPYEVVLEGDTNHIVTAILQESVPDMPQPESMFNIIQVRKGKLTSLYQTVRNRVVVDVDKRNRDFEVKISKDVNAAPQVIIRIKAQTVEQLKSRLDGMRLRQILDESELKHLASVIRQNVEKQKEIKRLFGIDMKIPADMQSSKRGKDFLWLSNNANSGMQNLLIFKLRDFWRGNPYLPSALKPKVDSVLRVNVPGEEDGMYMQLAYIREYLNGCWEMKGDAMGGPYVMKLMSDADFTQGRNALGKYNALVIIGFVYAPEMKKRNLIKQLEAVLTTIR